MTTEAEMIADAAAFGVDVNDCDPLGWIADDDLMCFVRWCRTNGPVVTADPRVVRRVLAAYVGVDRG